VLRKKRRTDGTQIELSCHLTAILITLERRGWNEVAETRGARFHVKYSLNGNRRPQLSLK